MGEKVVANIWNDLRELARRDPRKTAMVSVATLVMLVLAGHFLLQGPAAAPAATFNSPSPDKSALVPIDVRPRESSEALAEWTKEPKQPARRNLFALNAGDYPPDSSLGSAGVSRLEHDQKDQQVWDVVAKSMAAQADLRREQDFRFKSLQRAAAKLVLQKIIPGPPPKAQIDGTVVDEGGFVESFRLVRIQSDRISVEKDGMTVDVQLSQ